MKRRKTSREVFFPGTVSTTGGFTTILFSATFFTPFDFAVVLLAAILGFACKVLTALGDFFLAAMVRRV